MKPLPLLLAATFAFHSFSHAETGQTPAAVFPEASGTGIQGELKKWHRINISFAGPQSSEDADPNPFLDYRLEVVFTHTLSGITLKVPGYFAADGRAGETSADSGNIWRAHFSPPETGDWTFEATLVAGKNIAVESGKGTPATLDGDESGTVAGKFTIAPSDKTGRDNRSRGNLRYVGERYLRWAETGDYFLKQGADAPENLFAYKDFDGDFKTDGQKDKLVKTYKPHLGDWKDGDPTWQDGKGKGLIGAINYLASEGMNSVSFLTMNINGDDKNVFPYTDYDERERIDVSRMDQWEVVMNHADHMGLHLHFKTQEAENDKLLDGGDLGVERKLYYRELIARFGHHLALNWNLGEENHGQTDAQRKAMAAYFHENDPYGHNVVIHTYPEQKGKIQTPLLGNASALTGLSMQGSDPAFRDVHPDVIQWVVKSETAGKRWVVAYDEPGNASEGLTTDAENTKDPKVKGNYNDAMKNALWGTLLAGGAGNEWYFGYKYAHSDLTLQDFRSRDEWWDRCRFALGFFEENEILFHELRGKDYLIGNAECKPDEGFCFAREGLTYVIYLPEGKEITLDLKKEKGAFGLMWFDPENGGPLVEGSVTTIAGGSAIAITGAPASIAGDRIALIRAKK